MNSGPLWLSFGVRDHCRGFDFAQKGTQFTMAWVCLANFFGAALEDLPHAMASEILMADSFPRFSPRSWGSYPVRPC